MIYLNNAINDHCSNSINVSLNLFNVAEGMSQNKRRGARISVNRLKQ